MKQLLGVMLIITGVVFGIWAGLLWAFVGGILQIVSAVQASPMEGAGIAWGIVKIVFSGAIGAIAAFVLVVPGSVLANS